jgi:NDP-4-keto-2,6-dideoxyhexose 3-C-methyltransferase
LNDLPTYQDFAFFVERIKSDVVSFIGTEVGRGKKVNVYGASTKGNAVLQYFGLDHALITAAAERNPDKWGRVTVGSRIPIISEAETRTARPDYFLMLPWYFLEEFQAREKDFLLSSGSFIKPAPSYALI